MLVYRAINPTSTIRAQFEKREYMLVWLSQFGGVRQYMFTSQLSRRQDYKLNVIETSESIRSVPEKEFEQIQLKTESLTEEEFFYVKSILGSNKVFRVLKSGEEIDVAVIGKKIRFDQKQKMYDFEVTIQLKEEDILNV